MKTEEKSQRLNFIFRDLDRVAVAFSGGVDSTFLLAAAVRALGSQNVIAATAISATLTHEEKKEALALGKAIGVEHALLETAECNAPAFIANDPLRCYHCKKIRFQALVDWAAARGFEHVVEGSNVDDCGDYRPGQQAVAELDAVRSPLKEAGLTKAEIREISTKWNLSTAAKLSNACLATRLEYGLKITPERLQQVEDAENFLRPMIRGPLRVRHHGVLARIEVQSDFIPQLAEKAQMIDAKLKALGFNHVSLDMGGYQMGNMNVNIPTNNTNENE